MSSRAAGVSCAQRQQVHHALTVSRRIIPSQEAQDRQMKKIAILGSTGSIGTQSLEVIAANPDMEATVLAAGSNIDLLERQVREFRPKLVCVYREEKAAELKQKLKDLPVRVVSGMEGLTEAAVIEETEIVVTAVVGMIGIRPTIAALEAGKDIALANKETLVTAGHLIIPLAKRNHCQILPVDSEHSAIFQCLAGAGGNRADKILLTASGGPFRGKKKEELKNIRPEDALKHPNWVMGHKITIDSSTMVNKGLEVMEAKWLFGVDYDRIEVVIQPQSVVHSMVQFEDGAVIAQLGTADMKLPIQLALTWPERRFLAGKRLNFAELGSISFFAPDPENFPALPLAYRAGRKGGNAPTVFNAANEYAVARFLERRLTYPGITESIEAAMEEIPFRENPSLEGILETEQEVCEFLQKAGIGRL